ncbi:hypothetical protein NGRA_2560 [Nosema granulosis]|uniref:Uncharacterized protein n=1 Tax=Nosema granulosis TaxID=83296 RepID=A0A9P6KY33_9MICR|nr:hypothetical protein NGRA_2560 [Nosema granulosis]
MPNVSNTQEKNNENLFRRYKGTFFDYKYMFYLLQKKRYFTKPERIVYTDIFTNMLQFCRETLEILGKCDGIDLDYDFYLNLFYSGQDSLYIRVSDTDLFKPVADFLYKLIDINLKAYKGDDHRKMPQEIIENQDYLQLFVNHYKIFIDQLENLFDQKIVLRMRSTRPWYTYSYKGSEKYYDLSESERLKIFSLYERLIKSTSRLILPLDNCKEAISGVIKEIKDTKLRIMKRIKKTKCLKIADGKSIQQFTVEEGTNENCKTPYELSTHYNHLIEDKNNCKEKVKCGVLPPRQPYLYCNTVETDIDSGLSHLPVLSKQYHRNEYTNDNNCTTTYNRWELAPNSSYATKIYPTVMILMILFGFLIRKILK